MEPLFISMHVHLHFCCEGLFGFENFPERIMLIKALSGYSGLMFIVILLKIDIRMHKMFRLCNLDRVYWVVNITQTKFILFFSFFSFSNYT